MAAGYLANSANLECLAKICVLEAYFGFVLGVLTVLFNLLLIALPVGQVRLGNIELLRSINDGGLGGLDGLLKVLARLEDFSREPEAQRTFVCRYYIVFEGLNTADCHFPKELRGRIGISRRNVDGRVVEGEVFIKMHLFLLESLNTKGSRSLCECAH